MNSTVMYCSLTNKLVSFFNQQENNRGKKKKNACTMHIIYFVLILSKYQVKLVLFGEPNTNLSIK
jgi:hypothetical protein